MVKYLSSVHKALALVLSTTKKKSVETLLNSTLLFHVIRRSPVLSCRDVVALLLSPCYLCVCHSEAQGPFVSCWRSNQEAV